MIEVLKGNIVKELVMLKKYKLSGFFTILNSFILFFTLYFLFNNIIEMDEQSKAMFIISYVLWYFSLSLITEAGWIIVTETNKGTIEQWLLSPFPLWYLLLSKMLATNLINIFRTVLLLVLIMVLIQINLLMTLETFIVLIFSIVGMLGAGIIFGGIALLYRRIRDIIPIFQYILLAVISLPYSESLYSNLIPIYSVSSFFKKIQLNIEISFYDYIFFIISSLFFFIFGVVFFINCEIKIKKDGTLGKT